LSLPQKFGKVGLRFTNGMFAILDVFSTYFIFYFHYYANIVEDDTNRDIFVHVTGLGGLTIRENDQVEYEVVEGKKGLNAVQVKKI
jgi:CspA family cold shock protein